MSINPSVGRICLYRPTEEERDDIFHAAIVTMVHSQECVNLAIFDCNGLPYNKQSVVLEQDPDAVPEPGQCSWMKFQHGQQAKTEEVTLEAATVIDDFMQQTAERVNALNERLLAVESADLDKKYPDADIDEVDGKSQKQKK